MVFHGLYIIKNGTGQKHLENVRYHLKRIVTTNVTQSNVMLGIAFLEILLLKN